MIADKYGNYVRKLMWHCVGGVELTFHKRAFDFFIPLHIDLTIFKIDYELSKKCQLYPTHTVAT
jgi:hypothetical protein